MDWYPLFNSLRIAAASCVIVFFLGILCAYYAARLPRAVKGVLDVVLTLPMVLPPNVAPLAPSPPNAPPFASAASAAPSVAPRASARTALAASAAAASPFVAPPAASSPGVSRETPAPAFAPAALRPLSSVASCALVPSGEADTGV